MKFKSTLVDIPTLARIAQSLAVMNKVCWLRLSKTTIQFIVRQLSSATQVWASIPAEALFRQYTIESNADNVINLELSVDEFGRLLRNMVSNSEVTVKLTKRSGYPMLSCMSTFYGKHGGANTVTNDLNVRVLPSQSIDEIQEPDVGEPDVVIMLPSLVQLSYISNSLKTLADRLILSANMDGKFSVGIDTPAVKTETMFTNLAHPTFNQAAYDGPVEELPVQKRDKQQFCHLRIDAKDWCNLLRIGPIAKRVVACFCEDQVLVIYVHLADEDDEAEQNAHAAVLTYYIPTCQE
ncbi:checkpoint clamp complex protein Hus1 [Protomyces lactucae-debilis]|uniref:Checkpoint protein n=1 Tax=Protomyces lactucae-debilis TaxID=2754530 RepID=A0A1Y2FPF1_PROLT|nr:checkpoint clamp complex protein Hus1 [Protomyces lactucae-debilis]ORY85477.1 checkpoint clamp complex protein Hus1 [Protomyces lactucae-debilis]